MKSHVVVETAVLSEEELLGFMDCVEDSFEPGCGRVIHFLVSPDAHSQLRICTERKTVYPDYVLEEKTDSKRERLYWRLCWR